MFKLKKINHDFNIPVGCYGLKSDFLTHHFAGSGRLLVVADELKKMPTVCNCKDRTGASFNARKYIGGGYIAEGPQVAVDDGKQIEYVSLCDKCYLEHVLNVPVNEPVKVLKYLVSKNIIR